METLGRLKTIVASLEQGLALDDVPETLQWCIDTIERLQKELDDTDQIYRAVAAARDLAQQERDAALAEIERLKAEVEELDNIRLAQS